MIDERDVLERELHRFEPQPGLTDRVYRRRDRRRRNQRIGAGALAIIVALVSFAALTRAFRTTELPADDPTPRPQGIFSEVGGWIAYGNDEGIWAVNPTPGGTPADRIHLSERPGEPLEWSSDGSKLLVYRDEDDPSGNRVMGLFVLNTDGTETRLARDRAYGLHAGSLSPDGSELVYTASFPGESWQAGIYVVGTDGGSPQLIYDSSREVESPKFSPDGTQIAYVEGNGDWGNTLRVMNADGSRVRVLIDEEFSHFDNLAWSSDGSRLALNGAYDGVIWIVGADGSGLKKVDGKGVAWSPTGSQIAFEPGAYSSAGLWFGGGIWFGNPDGSGRMQVAAVGQNPVWSPDGSSIAYQDEGSVYVADLDGTDVRTLGFLDLRRRRTVAWNPLEQSASGEKPTAAAGGSGAAPFTYAIVLGAAGVLVFAWRTRRGVTSREAPR